ncbi:MAG: hypothetical protein ACE5LX_04585 [Nitrospinota bacterium]
MLVWLSLELWKRKRLDLDNLILSRSREIRSEKQALSVLNRASATDLEPLVAESLNGDRVIVEGPTGCLRNPERRMIEHLGFEVAEEPKTERADDNEPEPIRFIDMTPALLGLAAVVMALRYLALGLSDRELYVMAGIGYAAFVLIRTFSYKLRRPRNAPPPPPPAP